MEKLSNISIKTLKRLPEYLTYLEKARDRGEKYITAPKIAQDFELSEILVKKDLMYVTRINGKPKVGHEIVSLISDIKNFLGYNDISSAVLVGAGSLGKALLGYKEFKNWNVEIVVAFDNNEKVIGEEINSIKIMNISELPKLCERMQIHMGIITTSEKSAQDVCDLLIASGVKAIWNFAPVMLKVPNDIIVQNENLASSLAILSHKLSLIIK